ncbi:unnamed protein product [Caenorhabditis bovis]|uniref:Uncharacterized protein n=1 Tax=Caenorhabditis bovis TaxID=2654633 RepID=A0A8S1F9C2_9PELO|nr:unnamed protein product [Caenorhabditis bovis]
MIVSFDETFVNTIEDNETLCEIREHVLRVFTDKRLFDTCDVEDIYRLFTFLPSLFKHSHVARDGNAYERFIYLLFDALACIINTCYEEARPAKLRRLFQPAHYVMCKFMLHPIDAERCTIKNTRVLELVRAIIKVIKSGNWMQQIKTASYYDISEIAELITLLKNMCYYSDPAIFEPERAPEEFTLPIGESLPSKLKPILSKNELKYIEQSQIFNLSAEIVWTGAKHNYNSHFVDVMDFLLERVTNKLVNDIELIIIRDLISDDKDVRKQAEEAFQNIKRSKKLNWNNVVCCSGRTKANMEDEDSLLDAVEENAERESPIIAQERDTQSPHNAEKSNTAEHESDDENPNDALDYNEDPDDDDDNDDDDDGEVKSDEEEEGAEEKNKNEQLEEGELEDGELEDSDDNEKNEKSDGEISDHEDVMEKRQQRFGIQKPSIESRLSRPVESRNRAPVRGIPPPAVSRSRPTMTSWEKGLLDAKNRIQTASAIRQEDPDFERKRLLAAPTGEREYGRRAEFSSDEGITTREDRSISPFKDDAHRKSIPSLLTIRTSPPPVPRRRRPHDGDRFDLGPQTIYPSNNRIMRRDGGRPGAHGFFAPLATFFAFPETHFWIAVSSRNQLLTNERRVADKQ